MKGDGAINRQEFREECDTMRTEACDPHGHQTVDAMVSVMMANVRSFFISSKARLIHSKRVLRKYFNINSL